MEAERMRAIRYHEHGGPEVLAVETVDRPEPAADQILVQIRAASVNPVDTKVRAGIQGKEPPSLPSTPGTDFAGVVLEVGEDVSRFSAGDHVVGDYMDRWSPYEGTYAEYVAAPLDRVGKLPEGVSFEQAAGVAHVGTTAWMSLFPYGDLHLGDTCLVHGGSGGVGHVAVQLADVAGAEVIATAGNEAARSRLLELGADHVFDYDRPDLGEAIAAVGAPDVIVDHMIDRYLEMDYAVAATEATIVSIEASDSEVRFDNPPLARRKDLALYQIGPGRRMPRVETLERLGRFLEGGDLAVEIERTYGLEEAAQAHRDVIEESFVGKLVVVP